MEEAQPYTGRVDLENGLIERILEINKGCLQFFCNRYRVDFEEQDYINYMKVMVGEIEIPSRYFGKWDMVDDIYFQKGRIDHYSTMRDHSSDIFL